MKTDRREIIMNELTNTKLVQIEKEIITLKNQTAENINNLTVIKIQEKQLNILQPKIR